MNNIETRKNIAALSLSLIILGVAFTSCSEDVGVTPPEEELFTYALPEGFPEIVEPEDNQATEAKVELGRHLFYDKHLSRNLSIACASCHLQEHAFSDPNRVSVGVDDRIGTRNAPSLANVGYNRSLLWEGGVKTLEQQAIVPIIHPDEMDMQTDTLVDRLRGISPYLALFKAAWGDDDITIERITKSLAAFERTIISGETPFDKWKRGNETALSKSALRGERIFFTERGDCFHCHGAFNFTDNIFHNNGLSETEDEGRFRITQYNLDKGKFKTPTLRNIEVTAPYMHDGRLQSLEEVIDHYNNGGDGHSNSDPLIRPLNLTEEEQLDLLNFLKSLTDEEFLTRKDLSDPWQ
ncbi:MAG: c-type cytochrome [Ignavibacteriae bacterium]|nr:c-type cytochrome [Ignavibacteriota bacterium]MCB9215115.1 c-type cytochrome [Ignavibacteria bacterium]